MARPSRFAPEVRERAVRMVWEHQAQHASQWAAITSIAEKIGCAAETLRHWVRQAERDAGQRPGLTTDERTRFKQLERENAELRRVNEIQLNPPNTCRFATRSAWPTRASSCRSGARATRTTTRWPRR